MATVNQDPNQFIKVGFQPSTERLDEAAHSAWSIILTRDVPIHGPVKFKVTQFLDQKKKNTRVKVECVDDFVWAPEIIIHFELLIELGDRTNNYAVTSKRLPLNEDKLWPVFDLNSYWLCQYDCWSVKLMVKKRAAADRRAPKGWLAKRLLDQIYKKPASFERCTGAGRFTLKSEEAIEFHVHLSVLGEFSPVWTTWYQANHMNLAAGQPYAIELSTAALYSLLQSMYLGEISFYFIRNAHKIVQVAEMLLMNEIKDSCIKQMNDNLKKQDFELLMEWFLVSVEFSLDNCRLEMAILQQLAKLAQTDDSNKTLMKAQMEEHMQAHPDRMAKQFPGIIKISKDLVYSSIVQDVKQKMEHQYKKQAFEDLIVWFECAAYSLDDQNMAQRILLQLIVLSVNDAKCAQFEAQLVKYWTKKSLHIEPLFEAWTLADDRLKKLFLTKMAESAKLNETNKTLFQEQIKKYVQEQSADVISKLLLDEWMS